MGSTFCDQVVDKQAVESCTGKRNLKISLGIIQEKCTGRFYIVSSDGHMWVAILPIYIDLFIVANFKCSSAMCATVLYCKLS